MTNATDTRELEARLRSQCNCNLESSPCSAEDSCHLDREAADALATLRAERDEYRHVLADQREKTLHFAKAAEVAEAEFSRLRARVEALEKALEQWPLDDDELETIEFLANNDQRKKITPWEISALLAVYRTARAVKGGGDAYR